MEQWIDKELGGRQYFETRGVNRIPEEERRPPSIWNAFTLWPSMIIHIGNVPLGVLGPQFGLSLRASFSAAVVGICIGGLFPAYTGTLGPRLGLRQMATARYSFGYWGSKLCAVLNIVIGGGYFVVNAVVAGQMLSTVSDYHLSTTVGCILIVALSYLFSFSGYRLVMAVEKYFWILGLSLLIVLYAQSAPLVADAPNAQSGLPLTGAWLSFMTIQFSAVASWCGLSADFYCNYSNKTSLPFLFTLTYLGSTLATFLPTFLGILIGQIAILNPPSPSYSTMYNAHGLGGLLHTLYHPTPWAKAALVLSTFSLLGNNIATSYSTGLSIQLLGEFFRSIPRFICSFILCVVVALLAILGREHLSTIIQNFVSLLAYWTVSFAFILLIEDGFFRAWTQYDLGAWNEPRKLPLGLAAVGTLLIAYFAGGFMGTAQVWFVGPIAAKFGGEGGDVGIFLTGGITLLLYPVARYWERRVTGR